MNSISIKEWNSPLAYAAGISKAQSHWVLLYSGLHREYSGRYSILALGLRDEIKSDNWDYLAANLAHGGKPFENCWFGYLGYGLKNSVEKLPEDYADEQDSIASILPDLWMAKFGLIIRFDHINRHIKIFYEDEAALALLPTPVMPANKAPPMVGDLFSPLSRNQYMRAVSETIENIDKGNLYQANITRKFCGDCASDIEHFDIFLRLSEISPAPYSAFIKFGDYSIISSSPEQFLQMDEKGNMVSRPIKGTAPRFADPSQDEKSHADLAESTKDKAENLMIVDLMRNDFSRSCVAGSVRVEDLFSIQSYATIHHMVSAVYGRKRTDVSSIEVVKSCFPPGSMTGAPKIAAMKHCTEMERLKRGVYGGAIGYFCGNGSFDFSVVIRTLIMKGRKFEFQVGGGIVHDSTPVGEWEETIAKARGIARALGLEETRLREI